MDLLEVSEPQTSPRFPLPGRPTRPKDNAPEQEGTGIHATNPNQRQIVISKIEAILESIGNSIVNQEKHMIIKLRTRRKAKPQVTNPSTGVTGSLPDDGMRGIKFPSRNPQEAWKFAAILRILELSHEALTSGVVSTKRDIYYRDPELFVKQAVVDRYVEDIAYTLGVERDALNIVAAAKGLVAGSFIITKLSSTVLDYSTEQEGFLVPNLKEISSLELQNVAWVLVIEKEATFRTLSTQSYHQHSLAGRGVILTAKGYPDISTRQFLSYLHSINPQIPVFGLVDFDPDGLGILSTYKYGSAATAHYETSLAVPAIRWLGVKSVDVSPSAVNGGEDGEEGRAKHEEVGLLRLTPRDRRIARGILGRETFDEGGEWRREVQVMLMLGVKAEIQILSQRGGGLERWLDGRLVEELGM
ncbi:Spo11/DNA topoisomerase VI subunit A [Calycina marina]|uniref:DNA topoisomerase (ATP-hydrolyzing) n=1 Tax=Calycina marina TaxID=1763456 RepID=A0A9P8CHY5_9HELO|nr:Spo11/DNA topoisomerase VI subunit A [Calycina marina]